MLTPLNCSQVDLTVEKAGEMECVTAFNPFPIAPVNELGRLHENHRWSRQPTECVSGIFNPGETCW